MEPRYYVSRQMYWPTGDLVVEVASGGVDYANPDKLKDSESYKRLGSSREYDDPRQALESAFRVRDEWLKHAEDVRVEVGCTFGATLPFEQRMNDDALRRLVADEWETIQADAPRCANCGDPIWGDDWWYSAEVGEDVRFCSEACADDYYYGTYLDQVADTEYAMA